MPAARLSMRKVREVLRQRYACGASERVIAQSLGIGRTAGGEYIRRAAVIGISWPVPDDRLAPSCRHRGHRSAHAARHRARLLCQAGRWRLDRAQAEPAHHRPHRRRCKSWIACALGHKACRDNRSVLYHRMPRLFEALALARGDGRHARLLKALSRVELLIRDDWDSSPLTGEQRRDLLEISRRPAPTRINHHHQPGPGRSLARGYRRLPPSPRPFSM